MTATYSPVTKSIKRREDRLLTTCWCESFTFHVPTEWVREGRAVSCGGPRCRGELANGRLPRRGLKQQTSTHGTRTSYVRGCRCDECRAAESEYQRARWLKGKS